MLEWLRLNDYNSSADNQTRISDVSTSNLHITHGQVNTLNGTIDREYFHEMVLVDIACEPANVYPGGTWCGAALLAAALGGRRPAEVAAALARPCTAWRALPTPPRLVLVWGTARHSLCVAGLGCAFAAPNKKSVCLHGANKVGKYPMGESTLLHTH